MLYKSKFEEHKSQDEEDLTGEDFRDKVESARLKASKLDPSTPFPVSQRHSPSDRPSPPIPGKTGRKPLKRKELEKSKFFFCCYLSSIVQPAKE